MKKIICLVLMLIPFQVYSKQINVDRIYTKEEEEIIKNYLGTFYLHDREPAKNLVIVPSDQYGKIAVFNYVGETRYLCTPEFENFAVYKGMDASTCMFLDCVQQNVKKVDSFNKPYIIFCKTENGIRAIYFEEKEYFESCKNRSYDRLIPYDDYLRLEEKGE